MVDRSLDPQNSFTVHRCGSQGRRKIFVRSNDPNSNWTRSDGPHWLSIERRKVLSNPTVGNWSGGWSNGWHHFQLWIRFLSADRWPRFDLMWDPTADSIPTLLRDKRHHQMAKIQSGAWSDGCGGIWLREGFKTLILVRSGQSIEDLTVRN